MKLVGVGLERLELCEELGSGLALQPAAPFQLPGQAAALPSPSGGIREVELPPRRMGVQRESTDAAFETEICSGPVFVRSVVQRKGWRTDSFGSCGGFWSICHQRKGLALGRAHLSLAHACLSVGVSLSLLSPHKWVRICLISLGMTTWPLLGR